MQLIDSQAELIQVDVEIDEDVWRQSRSEHFLPGKQNQCIIKVLHFLSTENTRFQYMQDCEQVSLKDSSLHFFPDL